MSALEELAQAVLDGRVSVTIQGPNGGAWAVITVDLPKKKADPPSPWDSPGELVDPL